MPLIKKIFRNEYTYFKKLNPEAQKQLLSIFLFNNLNPIFAIFINAFIWRQSQDAGLVALFNVTNYMGLPIGFFINGILLKHQSIRRLYFAGGLWKAIAVLLVIILPVINTSAILLYGLLYGITNGLYWSNRNLINQRVTTSGNRIYFSGLDTITNTINNIIVPLIIGNFIIFGSQSKWYTPNQAYLWLGICTVVLSAVFGLVITSFQTRRLQVPQIVIRKATQNWNNARAMICVFGLFNGVAIFLPTLMILSFIGKEDALGVVQSLSATIAAIVMYTLARKVSTQERIKLNAASIVLSIIGSLSLFIVSAHEGVLAFIVAQAFAGPLFITTFNSITYDMVDKENQNRDNRYAYVFDSELFLNIGRVTGVLLFFLYCSFFSTTFAIRLTPLLFSLAQILIFITAYSLDKKQKLRQLALQTSSYNDQ